MKQVSLLELQGDYDIAYQTTPQLDDWFEPGFGVANISDNRLLGKDGLGVIWDATLTEKDDGLYFSAILDPREAPLNAGLMDKNGQMTRNPQKYEGRFFITKTQKEIIIRTHVNQGPLRIDVQFRKK